MERGFYRTRVCWNRVCCNRGFAGTRIQRRGGMEGWVMERIASGVLRGSELQVGFQEGHEGQCRAWQ